VSKGMTVKFRAQTPGHPTRFDAPVLRKLIGPREAPNSWKYVASAAIKSTRLLIYSRIITHPAHQLRTQMVKLAAARASNSQFAPSSRPVVVVFGGTSGYVILTVS